MDKIENSGKWEGAAQAPDYESIASDLKSKGFSRSDINTLVKDKGLPINETALNSLLEMFPEEEAEIQPPPENVFPEIEIDLMLGVQEQDFRMEDMFSEDRVSISFSERGRQEAASQLAPLLQRPLEDIKQSLEQDNRSLEEGYKVLGELIQPEKQRDIESLILAAETPDEQVQALQQAKVIKSTPVNTADMKQFTARSNIASNPDQAPITLPEERTIRENIAHNLMVAEEINKITSEVWEDAEVLDLFGDAGHLMIPIVGFTDEQIATWSVDFSTVLNDLRNSGNREQVRARLDKFLDTLEKVEGAAVSQNNTFYTMMAFDTLLQEVRDGSNKWVQGEISEQDFARGVESVLFGALEVSGLKGLSDVIFQLGKRVVPRRDVASFEYIPPQTDTKNTLLVETQRPGSFSLDAEASVRPSSVKQQYRDTSPKDTVQRAGMDPQEASERMIPQTTASVGKTLPNPELNYTELNELNVMNVSGSTAGERRAVQLSKDVGNSAKINPADTVLQANNIENSLGDFYHTMKAGDDLPFKTRSQAEAAKGKLFGLEGNVEEVEDGFVVRVKQTHAFNPEFDVEGEDPGKFLGISKMLRSTGYLLGALDPMRGLGEDYVKAVSVLSDAYRSQLSSLVDRYRKALNSWDAAHASNLVKVIGAEQDAGVRLSRGQLASTVPDASPKQLERLWESYGTVNDVRDELYRITDQRFKAGLESRGFKMLPGEDDADFVRKLSPQEGADIKPNERILNNITGESSTAKSLELQPDESIVRLMNKRVGSDGKEYDLLVVKNSDVKELPSGPLMKKDQVYIPRHYTETGWKVSRAVDSTVNGLKRTSNRVTHIVKSQKEAERIATELKEEALNSFIAENSTLDPEALGKAVQRKKQKLEEEIQFVESRENSDLDIVYGKDNDVAAGMSSVATRKRGEQLQGSNGLAPITENPLEALAKSVNGVERSLNHSVISGLQGKFMKNFSKYLQRGEGTSWNSSLEAMLRGKGVPVSVKQSMEAHHHYIETLKGMKSSFIVKWVDYLFRSTLGETKFLRGLDAPAQASVRWLMRNMATAWIIGRPLFQTLTNLAQAMWVTAKFASNSPVAASKGVVSSLFALTARINDDFSSPALGRILGVSEKQAKEITDFFFDESGLIDSVKFTDDIMSMAESELVRLNGAKGSSAVAKAAFYAKKAGGAIPKAAYAASSGAQAGSIKLVNLYAFFSELQVQIAKSKGSFKLDSKMKETLSFNTRKLTQSQNKANQFRYQSDEGVGGMALMFMQHLQKMLLDVVVSPAKVAGGSLVGKRLDSVSPYADNLRTAWGVTLFNLSMFGPAGFLGGGLGTDVGNEIREELLDEEGKPSFEVVDMILQGGILNELNGGLTTRMTPAAAVDSVYDMARFNEGVTDILLGPGPTFAASVVEKIHNIGRLVIDTPKIDTSDKMKMALHEIGGLVSGWNDIEKAYVAYNFHQLPYMRTLSGNSWVSESEAIALTLSIPPQRQTDFYNEARKKGTFGTQNKFGTSDQWFLDMYARNMNRELTDLKASGKYSWIDSQEVVQKWIALAKASLGDDNRMNGLLEDYMYKNHIREGSLYWDQFVKPFFHDNDLQETAENLDRLASDYKDVPGLSDYAKAKADEVKTLIKVKQRNTEDTDE